MLKDNDIYPATYVALLARSLTILFVLAFDASSGLTAAIS